MLAFLRGNPRFMRFWVASWASELGDWIRNMTVTYMVMELSGESPMAVGLTLFCEFAPIFLFGLFVGVLADRWDRKRTIMGAVLFRILLMGLLIGAVYAQVLILVYIVAFLSAIGTVFYRTPQPAFTMQFVPQEDRKMAANLRQMSVSTMFLMGAPLATFLYFTIGGALSLLLTVALFALNVVLISTIRVEPTTTSQAEGKGWRSVFAEMNDGFRYAWGNRQVRPLMLSGAFLGLGGGFCNVLSIFVITEFLGMTKEMFSVLLTVQGAAMLTCSLFIAKLKLPTDRMLSYGMVVMGLGMAGMVGYANFYAVSVGLCLLVAGMIAVNVAAATLTQTKVEFAYQGRTNTIMQVVNNGPMVLAMLSAGWLHDLFTLRPVMVGGGVSMIVAGILCFAMYERAQKWARQEERQEVNLSA